MKSLYLIIFVLIFSFKALAKTGILVKLAKFWWILLAPLAFFGKFLSGKESSSNNSSASVKRRKRKK